MTLPIKWHVVPDALPGHSLLRAELIHNQQRYVKQTVMPPMFSKQTWWLVVAATQAEITNAVKNPPADR